MPPISNYQPVNTSVTSSVTASKDLKSPSAISTACISLVSNLRATRWNDGVRMQTDTMSEIPEVCRVQRERQQLRAEHPDGCSWQQQLAGADEDLIEFASWTSKAIYFSDLADIRGRLNEIEDVLGAVNKEALRQLAGHGDAGVDASDAAARFETIASLLASVQAQRVMVDATDNFRNAQVAQVRGTSWPDA